MQGWVGPRASGAPRAPLWGRQGRARSEETHCSFVFPRTGAPAEKPLRRACREAPEAAWGESRLPLHPARLQAGLEADPAMGRAGASSPALAARPCTHLVLPAPRESP